MILLGCRRGEFQFSERLRRFDCLFKLRSGFRAKLPSAIKQHLCFTDIAGDLNNPIIRSSGWMDYDAVLEKGIHH